MAMKLRRDTIVTVLALLVIAAAMPFAIVDTLGKGRVDLGTGCFRLSAKTRELFGLAGEEVLTFDRFLGFIQSGDRPLVEQTVEESVHERIRSELYLLVLATCVLAATTALSQSVPASNPSLTLAPADATSSDGSGAGVDEEKAKAAALAKATLNPFASLISLPLQNNFDSEVRTERPSGDYVSRFPSCSRSEAHEFTAASRRQFSQRNEINNERRTTLAAFSLVPSLFRRYFCTSRWRAGTSDSF